MDMKQSDARVILILLEKSMESSVALVKEFIANIYKPDDLITLMILFDYRFIDLQAIVIDETDEKGMGDWKIYLDKMREKYFNILDECRKIFGENDTHERIQTLFKEIPQDSGHALCDSALEMNADIVIVAKKLREQKLFVDKNVVYIAHHNKKPTIIIPLGN